ncbi:RHS repeat-associated core domain-containing protein [Methylobacterium sp. Leaf102]|uniref:RHS repeat-associated core domain-containing protein n=1 Tax=Methylobacterium sp. Leaf102 TaxID=1736253 RepID=UPI0009EC96BB|nr:RHS repeat-associated core domain-containing protein [Methylobacterium sp. Leaf102]
MRRLLVAEADNDNTARARNWSPFSSGDGPPSGGRSFGSLALKDDPEAIDALQICPIRFQGQWEDPETGLNYNRLRYYDPILGQYVSPDPLRIVGGARSHGYVTQPTGWLDPLGLTACCASSALDWSKTNKDGTTVGHVNKSHAGLNLSKPQQGVFYGNPQNAIRAVPVGIESGWR